MKGSKNHQIYNNERIKVFFSVSYFRIQITSVIKMTAQNNSYIAALSEIIFLRNNTHVLDMRGGGSFG